MTAWTEIERLTAPASGYFDFQALDLAAYSALEIIGSGITVTSDQSLVKAVFYKAGPTALVDYAYHQYVVTTGATFVEESDTAQAEVPLCFADTATYKVGNAAGKSIGFSLLLGHPTLASKNKHMTFIGSFINSAGAGCRFEGGAMIKDTAAITGVRIGGSSDLVAGKVILLGLGTA